MNNKQPKLTPADHSSPTADEALPDTQTLIDVAALAERLGVTQRFVRRLTAENRVPFLKIGKFVRFDPREIEPWLDSARSDHR
jgi:excisionase family DNA binding protein